MATRRVVFHYPRTLIDVPVISRLIKQYDLEVNILRAQITPAQEGLMVLALTGELDRIDAALEWVVEVGVRLQPLEKDVVRNETKCTHCGACVNICPTNALAIDLETREVHFDPDRCIACELCVPVCPPRAMEVAF